VDGERARRGIRLAQAGLLINAVLVVVKVVTGILGHSYALVADGVESSLDIFSSLIVWRGIHVAARSADESLSFRVRQGRVGRGRGRIADAHGCGTRHCIAAVREILTPHHVPAPFTLIVLVRGHRGQGSLFRYVLREGECWAAASCRRTRGIIDPTRSHRPRRSSASASRSSVGSSTPWPMTWRRCWRPASSRSTGCACYGPRLPT
jgi:hypothetical protein